MKQLYLFYSGQIQLSPIWAEYLIPFLLPRYIGNFYHKWFGITFHTPDSLGGETLFMYWRRNVLLRW